MKYVLFFIILFSYMTKAQVYKDVYSTGFYMLSDENNPDNNVLWLSPTIASSITFTLPPNFGQAGYAMSTLGDGSITWTDITSVVANLPGDNGAVMYNNNGSFGGSNNLFWNNSNNRLGIRTNSPQYTLDINGILGIGTSQGQSGLILHSEQGATDYQFYFLAPASLSSSKTYTWPGNIAPQDQIMSTDGNGNLTWSTSWASGNGDCVGQGLADSNDVSNNTSTAADGFVGGGDNNNVSGLNGFIAGGENNVLQGDNSAILAGVYNSIGSSSDYSLIGGGATITILSSYSVVYAGQKNEIDSSANYSFIGAGQNNYTNSEYSAIGAGASHTIGNGGYNFVGGGQTNVIGNSSFYSSILAGQDNSIGTSSSYSAIGGGQEHDLTGSYSFVGGGYNNDIVASYSTILGGRDNDIAGDYSFVAAGQFNEANGQYSMALGYDAVANSKYSIAIGRRANAIHPGSFVFTGGTDASVSSSAANQMTMRYVGSYYLYTNSGTSSGRRLNGGASSWSSVSDRNLKENILTLNKKSILDKIEKLNIFSWSYKGYEDEKIRNYGPMAQDFYSLFGNDQYGEIGSETTISFYDLSSVGIVGVQALNDIVLSNKLKIDELKTKNEKYKLKLEELKKLKSEIENKINKEEVK